MDQHIEDCLERLGIASLCDWDVLVFLYRHRANLASPEQIGRLLGYRGNVVGQALDTLESLKLVERSRASQGVRLYQFLDSETHLPPESCFHQLIRLADSRSGRLRLAGKLRKRRAGLHLAAIGGVA